MIVKNWPELWAPVANFSGSGTDQLGRRVIESQFNSKRPMARPKHCRSAGTERGQAFGPSLVRYPAHALRDRPNQGVAWQARVLVWLQWILNDGTASDRSKLELNLSLDRLKMDATRSATDFLSRSLPGIGPLTGGGEVDFVRQSWPLRTPKFTTLVRFSADGPRGTFESVQALRGIAAVMVAIFHAGLRFDHTEATFRVGNAGVDIFFIISGFVMWTVAARRPIGPITFLSHRLVRLVPLYWLWTLLLVAAWSLMPSAFPRLHPTVSHVLLSLAFIPHTSPDIGRITPVLGQGWTLNFEMLFYLLFALVLTLPSRLRFAAIATTLLLLPFARHITTLPPGTLLSPLLVEFLGGILLARLVSGGSCLGVLPSWGCIALGTFLLIAAHPSADDDMARLFQYGVPALLIVGGAVGLELNGRWPVGKLGRLIGDASYSIYLTHAFVISMLGKMWPTDIPPWIFIVSATIVATSLGAFAYLLVERPLFVLLRGRRPGSGAPVAISLATGACI
jgi:exopolysaccharide production protein ExoZ